MGQNKKAKMGLGWPKLLALFNQEHQPPHEQKWADLDSDQPDLARQALKSVQAIRDNDVEAGEAYLMGMADYHRALKRRRLLKSVDQKFSQTKGS